MDIEPTYTDLAHSAFAAEGHFRSIVELAPDALVTCDRDGCIRLVNRQTEMLFGYMRDDLLGHPIERLIPERFHAAHQQHRARYVAAPQTRAMGGTGTALHLFGRRCDGSEFPAEVRLSPLVDDLGELSVISSIRDVSERQRAEAAHREHARERDLEVARARAAHQSHELGKVLDREHAALEGMTQARVQLEALQALTDTALEHLALDDLLPAVLEQLRDVLNVDNAALLLLDADGQTLRVRAARGLEEAVAAQVRVPVGEGFAGRIAARRAPLIVDDLATFPLANPLLRERLRAVVGVPLLLHGQMLGVLHMGTTQPHPFTERDVQLLQQVASRVALAIDRAQAHEAEQAARQEAEQEQVRWQAAMDSAPEFVITCDADLRQTYMNPAYARLRDGPADPSAPSEEISARYGLYLPNGIDLFPADQLPLTRAVREGQPIHDIELVLRGPDGEPRLIVWEAAPMRSAEGELLGAVAIGRDFTERKRAEEALRSSEERFRTMADTAPVFIWLAGADGLVTFVNAPWLQFTGRSLMQELGNGWADGVHPDDHQRCLQTYRTAFQVRECFTMEYRLRRFDGEYRWVADSGVPRFAPDGAFLGYIGSAIDITENKRLERERAEACASELALLEVNRHMDQFLATAAHDLRSPISGVVMGVELAQRRVQRLATSVATPAHTGRPSGRSDDVSSATNALEHAGRATQRLSRLISCLFDVAQVRAGKLEITPVACDLGDLLRELVGAQRLVAPDRTIRLDLPTAEAVPVVADPDRIGQVATNFLTNALKYSPPDRPVDITVALDERQVRVMVRDEGPGLALEQQARVWEPFHRVPGIEVHSGVKESLGLGLYICKTIIDQHGGQVGVESAEGKGSAFWFALPLAGATC